MELSLLEYPRKSHRKKILLPEESEDLAEFLGIVAGDGGISGYWQLRIYLNAISDRDYLLRVQYLIYSLFHLKVNIRMRRDENTLIVDASSVELVDFLISKGAIRGNKVLHGVDIPNWVITNTRYIKAFIRGVFDTDGCTYYDKHRYKDKIYQHLGIAIANKSLPLLNSMVKNLTTIGYHPTVSTSFRIMLRREGEVLRFFQDIKPANPRHQNKFINFLEEYRSGRNGTVSKAGVRATGP